MQIANVDSTEKLTDHMLAVLNKKMENFVLEISLAQLFHQHWEYVRVVYHWARAAQKYAKEQLKILQDLVAV